MKKSFILTLFLSVATLASFAQQDKSKRASPPAVTKQTISSGATITIDYSQPSVKGRTIGGEIAPYGKVWRTGANEATIFEVDKNVKVEGKALAAGKYALHSIPGEKEWTLIFNKKWQKPGTEYSEAEDVLRVSVNPVKSPVFMEKMLFVVGKNGKVTLNWGGISVPFTVK